MIVISSESEVDSRSEKGSMASCTANSFDGSSRLRTVSNKSERKPPRSKKPFLVAVYSADREIDKINDEIAKLAARRREVKAASMARKLADGANMRYSRRPRKASSRTEVSGILDIDPSVQRITDGTRQLSPPSGNVAAPNAPPGGVPRGTIRRRLPRTAAVTITSLDPNVSYAEMLKRARDKISLNTMGIENSRIRKGINGGVIIEIPGADGASKADCLALKLKEVLGDTTARITQPTVMGEVRVWNLDDSISSTEIINVISTMGDCDAQNIRLGSFRRMSNGLHSIWIKCPLAAAAKITHTGKLKVGWTIARVELLEARPVKCYRCWRFGHVRNTCSFPEDRTGSCFRCSSREHRIGDCKNDPHCVICASAGRTANHRLGSTSKCFERDPTAKPRSGLKN